jgi:hypothetical protein
MYFLQAQVAGVSLGFGIGMQPDFRLFEQPEVVATAFVMGNANDLACSLINDNLRL